MPAVSVIMPVYNAGKYLRGAIDSVLAQTFRDFELLLIDDGATDGSGAVCDEYAAKDARVRVRHGRNGGICASRNVGLSLVRGEWIGFCDHDDYMEPDCLETAYRAIRGTDFDLVKFDHRTDWRHADGRVVSEYAGVGRPDCDWTLREQLTAVGYPFLKAQAGLVWDGLYRRAFVEAQGMRFDESFKTGGEDCAFMTRFLAAAGRGRWIGKVLYRHFYNVGTSTSAGCHLRLMDDYLAVARLERELWGFPDAGVRFASFAEWSMFMIHFVFMAAGCTLSLGEQTAWLRRYADELVGKGAKVPLAGLPPKRRFLYVCWKLKMLGIYLVLKKAVVRFRRRRCSRRPLRAP